MESIGDAEIGYADNAARWLREARQSPDKNIRAQKVQAARGMWHLLVKVLREKWTGNYQVYEKTQEGSLRIKHSRFWRNPERKIDGSAFGANGSVAAK